MPRGSGSHRADPVSLLARYARQSKAAIRGMEARANKETRKTLRECRRQLAQIIHTLQKTPELAHTGTLGDIARVFGEARNAYDTWRASKGPGPHPRRRQRPPERKGRRNAKNNRHNRYDGTERGDELVRRADASERPGPNDAAVALQAQIDAAASASAALLLQLDTARRHHDPLNARSVTQDGAHGCWEGLDNK